VGGHQNDRHFVALLPQRAQYFQPGHSGHFKIHQNQVGGAAEGFFESLGAVGGLVNVKSLWLQYVVGNKISYFSAVVNYKGF